MALYTPMNLTLLSEQYGLTTAGQAVTAITPNAGGDSIALQGSVVLLRFQNTGTANVFTLDSVELSNFGSDVNVTVSPGATAIMKVAIKTDPRFKQTSGNIGYLNLTYSGVTGSTIEAESLA